MEEVDWMELDGICWQKTMNFLTSGFNFKE
jgi:hypothetical protein